MSRTRVRRYEVVGDAGTLTWDLAARRLELSTAQGSEVLDSDPASFDLGATYKAAMSEFVSAVGRGAPTSQDILDGLASTQLALRAKGT